MTPRSTVTQSDQRCPRRKEIPKARASQLPGARGPEDTKRSSDAVRRGVLPAGDWLPGSCPHLPLSRLPLSSTRWARRGLRGEPLRERAWTASPPPTTRLLLLSQGGKELFVFPVALIYGPLCSLSICTNSVKRPVPSQRSEILSTPWGHRSADLPRVEGVAEGHLGMDARQQLRSGGGAPRRDSQQRGEAVAPELRPSLTLQRQSRREHTSVSLSREWEPRCAQMGWHILRVIERGSRGGLLTASPPAPLRPTGPGWFAPLLAQGSGPKGRPSSLPSSHPPLHQGAQSPPALHARLRTSGRLHLNQGLWVVSTRRAEGNKRKSHCKRTSLWAVTGKLEFLPRPSPEPQGGAPSGGLCRRQVPPPTGVAWEHLTP